MSDPYEDFIVNFYWRFYCLRPIAPRFVDAAANLAQPGALQDITHLGEAFEEEVEGICEVYIDPNDDHTWASGKKSHLAGTSYDFDRAAKQGFITNAAKTLSTELFGQARGRACGFAEHLARTVDTQVPSDLVLLFLLDKMIGYIRKALRDTVVHAYRFENLTNELIFQATRAQATSGVSLSTIKAWSADKAQVRRRILRFSYPIVDIPSESIPSDPLLLPQELPAPNSRLAKRTVDIILTLRDQMDAVSRWLILNLLCGYLLRCKNAEIGDALNGDGGPLYFSDSINLAILPQLEAEIRDWVDVRRDYLIERGWSTNTLTKLLTGNRSTIYRQTTNPDIIRRQQDMRAQIPTGLVKTSGSRGTTILMSSTSESIFHQLLNQEPESTTKNSTEDPTLR
ncbi:MAG: hypothetical protein LBV06_09640 [Propionibacteriaceae bacterium]|jgi:hypothetical protein|nr:hypothetical protein [Propionibacteriaceae bacterium]